ncbi:MAG: class I adenylate-forming enzyme family protein [Hydrogenophaga sp.]
MQIPDVPERPAIYLGDQGVATYSEWLERAARMAARLRAQGFVPGDRVVLFMRNHPRYLELLFGAGWAGLVVVVPVNAKLHVKEVQWIVDNAQARWAFVTSDVMSNLADLPGLGGAMGVDSPECDAWMNQGAGLTEIEGRAPDDTAWLFCTSGTTAQPKGVLITHRNLMTMGLGYFVDVDAVKPADAIVCAAPMSHGAGLCAIPHLMAGAHLRRCTAHRRCLSRHFRPSLSPIATHAIGSSAKSKLSPKSIRPCTMPQWTISVGNRVAGALGLKGRDKPAVSQLRPAWVLSFRLTRSKVFRSRPTIGV